MATKPSPETKEQEYSRFRTIISESSKSGGMFAGTLNPEQWARVHSLRKLAKEGTFTNGVSSQLTNEGIVDAGLEALEILAKTLQKPAKPKASPKKPARKPAKKASPKK